ncbi:FtsK/SpoIIIE domain-containing protein [Amycolatopsis sp. La24]|uniref:FtsK/SpoIIIE domain-containing protein n=1 Tax=Amycolatopsis sp. La24 TaxID=3028304 RepID=UPI0023B01ABC|nr:FtsK/SpoIIIE domain-containing protein [Amycolatopsis sp. La24]
MSDNDTQTPGTVVPFRRPEGTVAAATGATVEGEVLDPADAALTVSEPRQTWGTRVLHGTGRVLAGPSDETRARLAERTVELGHATGTRLRSGSKRGRRVLGRTSRFLHRHASITAKGAEAARQRRRADRDHADVKAARALAKEKGDAAQVESLTRQLNEGRHVRVDTAKKWAELAWSLTWKAALVLVVAFGGSLVTGGINGFGHWLGVWNADDALAVWRAVFTTVYQVGAVVFRFWWGIPVVWMGVKLFRFWKDGNRLGEGILPAHLRKQATRVQRSELTEGALAMALSNSGVSELKAKIKEGWPNRDTDNAWVQFPMIDGKGWSAKIRLPQGVPVKKMEKAVDVLAHNLGCRPVELFIRADDEDAQVMDLFRLNPGVLREPVDPYPLLHEGTSDYWTGFPAGCNLRGEPVTTPMSERNFVIAGTMGSGKSTLLVTLLNGAVLDPLVDVDVFLFAENNDYEALMPCLKTFSDGGTDDNVEAAVEHLQNLYADLTVRGQLLKKHGVNSVQEAGREIVAKEPGLRPRIVVLDECQRFFRQDKPEDRKKIVNLVCNLFMASRKYAVHLAFLTPSPSDQSLPREVVALSTNRACGAINGNKARNNAVLGEKAHEEGISALDLKPKTPTALNDVGTLITVGFMDEPGALRSYYLTPAQQAGIVARALEARGAAAAPEQVEAPRDVLADILAVTRELVPREGEHHPRASAVAEALRTRWSSYHGWKIEHVTDALAGHGYQVPTTNRVYPVDPEKVAAAIAGRETSPAE